MAFNIIITDGGQSDYNHCLDYLFYILENAQATRNLLVDIEETLEQLKINASAYALCESAELAARNLRKVHLRRHSYKIVFKIIGEDVYIEAILHDKQLPEKWLK